MGEYRKTYDAIHKYRMERLLWEAKIYELRAEYVNAQREILNWDYNGREGKLSFKMGGNDYAFLSDTSVQEVKEFLEHEYSEYMDYIVDIINDCDIDIGECEGYLRELEYIDGERN